MASLTLLEIIDTAFGELGLTQPTQVVGSVDLQSQKALALVNREGWALQQMNEWVALQELNVINITPVINTTGDIVASSAIITNIPDTSGITPASAWVCTGGAIPVAARVLTVDSPTQVTLDSEATDTVVGEELTFAQDTYNLPTDFDRYINQTSWDRTNRWQVLGPDSPQVDEWHRSGIVTTGPRRHARQVGHSPTAYRLWPPPGSTEIPWETVFEYVSNCWVVAANGTAKVKFTADDDTSLIDPQAIILGLKWRFLQSNNFQYADQKQEWMDYVSSRIAKDGGAKILSMAPRIGAYLINSGQVQDGYYPSNENL